MGEHDYDDRDDFADDGEDMAFDCPAFWTPEGWYCPAQGSEECDWECPY